MSGWDVADVSYSEQRLAEHQGDGRRARTQAKFFHFLHEYQEDGTAVYVDRLRTNYQAGLFTCEVDFEDLSRFDPLLADDLRSNPSELLPWFEAAAKEVILRSMVKPDPDALLHEIQIQLIGFNRFTSLRDLRSDLVSRLVAVSGIVVSATRASTKAVGLTLQCRNCKTTRRVPVNDGFGGARIPRNCDHVPLNPAEKCPIDPFIIVPDQCAFVDIQSLKLQESPESVPTGEMPRTLALHVARYLVNRVKPGTRCRAVGVLSTMEGGGAAGRVAGAGGKSLSAAAVRVPYLRVIGLSVESEGAVGARVSFTPDEEERLKQIARDPRVYERLSKDIIAPEIWGREDIKKAVAAQLFGGVRQILPDGIKLRGDIHVLLLGDPSVAKSQFLKFAEKCSPVAVYTSGKGSSAAGLTASVVRDASTGEFHLEGGALVLADGGIVCIDEFDKMRPQDRVAIHEAMEQQTISIAKAGITTTLNSRAGVLAAANPVFGRYDDLKSPEENIDFQSTILSRFDMIFVIQDKRDPEQDRAVTQHVLRMYQQGAVQSGRDAFQDDLFKDMATLKRYVAYARARCQPCLSPDAHTKLVNYYVGVRQQMRADGGASVIPITVRQLEAIIRIAESLARMQLLPVATSEHVDEAIRLFQVSTLHAAQTGAVSGEGLAGSMYGSRLKEIETRILRRIPLGSTAPKQRVVDEMKNAGEDEALIRKAIELLLRQGELTEAKMRKILQRPIK